MAHSTQTGAPGAEVALHSGKGLLPAGQLGCQHCIPFARPLVKGSPEFVTLGSVKQLCSMFEIRTNAEQLHSDGPTSPEPVYRLGWAVGMGEVLLLGSVLGLSCVCAADPETA